MRRFALLPHVFVAGRRPPSPPTAYVSRRTLRAAIAANAALMPFAGDDEATRAPAEAAGFTAPPEASGVAAAPPAPDAAPPSPEAAPPSPDAAPLAPDAAPLAPNAAPANPRRDAAPAKPRRDAA